MVAASCKNNSRILIIAHQYHHQAFSGACRIRRRKRALMSEAPAFSDQEKAYIH